MKRFLLALMAAGGLWAQSAEEIAAKSVEAMGGAAQFDAVKSVRMRGRMGLKPETATPFNMLAKRPNRFRMEFTVGPDHVTQAYDGMIGWQSVMGEHKSGPTTLAGVVLAHLTDQASNVIGGPLVDRVERRNKLETAGREVVNGVNCYKLKVTFGTGDTMILFIDPGNFRVVQEDVPVAVNGKETLIERSLSDYRKFGSIFVACQVVTRQKGQTEGQHLNIESVEINPAINDAAFKMPAK